MRKTVTDLEKLKEVFSNQSERGIKSSDWNECEAVVEPNIESGGHVLKVPSLQVGFVFNRNGRFIGAYNWKE